MIYVLEILCSATDWIFGIVSFFYSLNYYIGLYVVKSILSFFSLLFTAINHLYLLFIVLIEDFNYFVLDISSLIQDFIESISKTYDFLVELFSTVTDEEESGFSDLFIGKFAASRMADCRNFLKITKEGTITLLVFLWESTSFFFNVLKCLNKAPFLAILLVAEAIDSLIGSVYTFFVSITLQTIITLLIDVCLIILVIKFGVHLYIRDKVKSMSNKFSETIIPSLTEKCRSSIRFSVESLFRIQEELRNLIRNGYRGTLFSLRKIGREVVSKTPTKAALKIQLEREKLERLCVVCMDGKRNTMLLNCRHLILCHRCANQIVNETRECPICRSYILDIINVYT